MTRGGCGVSGRSVLVGARVLASRGWRGFSFARVATRALVAVAWRLLVVWWGMGEGTLEPGGSSAGRG